MQTNARWYIKVEEHEEGPFSLEQLRCYPLFTPDTWVRREGSEVWRRARNVPELESLFLDEEGGKEEEEPAKVGKDEPCGDVLTAVLPPEPSPWLLWLGIAFLILTYVLYML